MAQIKVGPTNTCNIWFMTCRVIAQFPDTV